jgi:hypothetical protein
MDVLTFFSLNLLAGLFCLLLAVSTGRKRRNAENLDSIGVTEIGGVVLFVIAALWPFWLIKYIFSRDDSK